MTAPLIIRPATFEDGTWIIPLSARFHTFGPPPWRTREVMDRAVAEELAGALRPQGDDVVVLVAELAPGTPAGFVHVLTAVDYFTGEQHSHVSNLAVMPEAEGRGVARALMAEAEAWARSRGHRLVTLNVFGGNERARALYDRLGYAPDTTRLVKVIGS